MEGGVFVQATAKQVVERLIDASVGRDYAAVLTLLDEKWFCQTEAGRIYIGHRGLSDWIRDSAREGYTDVDMIVESIRELDAGYVLVSAMIRRTLVRGETEVVPGTWLYRVADGKVTTVVYFRTEDDAIRSIRGPARATPTQLLEQNFDAYNRRDFVALVSLTSPDIRYTSSVAGDDGEIEQGIDALARLLAALDDERTSVLIDSPRMTELGEGFVIAEAGLRIDRATGEVEELEATWLARVQDNKIAEFILYPDFDTARAAAVQRIAADRRPDRN